MTRTPFFLLLSLSCAGVRAPVDDPLDGAAAGGDTAAAPAAPAARPPAADPATVAGEALATGDADEIAAVPAARSTVAAPAGDAGAAAPGGAVATAEEKGASLAEAEAPRAEAAEVVPAPAADGGLAGVGSLGGAVPEVAAARRARRARGTAGAPARAHGDCASCLDDLAVGPGPRWARGSAEEYTHHGVRRFVRTADDRLSTFSVDVDTASWSIARRKLREGVLPPEAAVRVEEFVNAMSYDYPRPERGPFAVAVEGMPDPVRPGHTVLRIGVQGADADAWTRVPVHLTFLVDVSGSMDSPDKLPLAKRALHELVDGLGEEDTVAIATYAGHVSQVLGPTPATERSRIHRAIEQLRAGGRTAMADGLELAYRMAERSFVPEHENRVVVLSDGDANVGARSWQDMLGIVERRARAGITLTTVGFGMGNYRDTLMEQLADHGDGSNYYVDDADEARRIFVERLGGTLVTIARDVKVQVEFDPERVVAWRLLGYENRAVADRDFRNDRVDAGEVGAGLSVTAVYDLVLRERPRGHLATVRVRWEAPGPDGRARERAWTVNASAIAPHPRAAGADTRIAWAAAAFAEVLRGSPFAREVSLWEVADVARGAARPGHSEDRELIELIERAAALGAAAAAAQRRP